MRRVAVAAISAAIFVLSQAPTRAATLLFNNVGDVTAITGLDVGGSFFDIGFRSDFPGMSYATAYGGTNPQYSNAVDVRTAIVTLLNSQSPDIPNIAGTLYDPELGAVSGFI